MEKEGEKVRRKCRQTTLATEEVAGVVSRGREMQRAAVRHGPRGRIHRG